MTGAPPTPSVCHVDEESPRVGSKDGKNKKKEEDAENLRKTWNNLGWSRRWGKKVIKYHIKCCSASAEKRAL